MSSSSRPPPLAARARRAVVAPVLATVGAGATPATAAASTPCRSCSSTASAAPAAQYETQALRFASNDYPNVVTGIDRISATPSIIYPILDEFFDAVMAETGDDQIYAVGHSQGTSVMYGYLSSSPERAARVAKYIGIDGFAAATCPGGVECMGHLGPGQPGPGPRPAQRAVRRPGPHAVGRLGRVVHRPVRVLHRDDAATRREITKEPGHIDISGRALNFPANTGIDGSVLDVYEVRADDGTRLRRRPVHTVAIGADGNFGPLEVKRNKHYELQLTRQGPDGPLYQHFYYEPFVRSNHLLRLNLAPIGSPLSEAIQRGPHTTVSIVRQKEWWGANPNDAANVDTLEVSTRIGADVVDAGHIINGATAPYAASTIAVLSFDIGVDGDDRHERAVPARTVPVRRRRLHAGDRSAERHDHVPPPTAPGRRGRR